MKYKFKDKTIEGAIQKGLKRMALTKDEAEIVILDEGMKGLFSLEGRQPAAVMIEAKDTSVDYLSVQREIRKHLAEVLRRAGFNFEKINTTVLTGRVIVNIISADNKEPDMDFLNALETLIVAVLSKKATIKVNLDMNLFLRKREEEIKRQVIDLAKQIKETNATHTMTGLKPFERRVVHETIRSIGGLESQSIGDGPEKDLQIRKII